MWRCRKCNFLHLESEKPTKCYVCEGDKFTEVLVAGWKEAEQNMKNVKMETLKSQTA